MSTTISKPLGRKAYGSIGHLPGSRLGPGDHCVSAGQAAICTTRPRDKHDTVIVQEKLDGSCCAVARINGQIVPLQRKGYPANSSPYEQHHLFHDWAMANQSRFKFLLSNGERIVGEWLAQAHGTRYVIRRAEDEPWVPFDIFTADNRRLTVAEFCERCGNTFYHVATTRLPPGAILPQDALDHFQRTNRYCAIDPLEGVVYRVERHGTVDFLAKWVRPDKVDGKYLPEITGQPAVWNWRPETP